jgi:hypothetical protein
LVIDQGPRWDAADIVVFPGFRGDTAFRKGEPPTYRYADETGHPLCGKVGVRLNFVAKSVANQQPKRGLLPCTTQTSGTLSVEGEREAQFRGEIGVFSMG